MDEQRMQAYVALIEQLLSCPQGKETEVLQGQTELIDAGLLTVMQQYADRLEQQGGLHADWLRQFGQGLATAMAGTNVQDEGIEDTAQFLLTILRLVAKSQGDAQQVYSFLAQHQNQLNETLLRTLPQLTAKLLADNPKYQEAIATELVVFGNLINQFPLGQRWLNLELGIAAYKSALQVFTREAFLEQWANTQHNLAVAYGTRIWGKRAENIEEAIITFQDILQIRTREAFPEKWASIQHNLANAYRERIQGERAENLEQAITGYQNALEVFTREAFSERWAATQHNLATVFWSRVQGNRAKNIEQAITLFRSALEIRTREAFPEQWAVTQNNLANAYRDRIQGERVDNDNLEEAITAFQNALKVRTYEASPEDWATTQNNLGISYWSRIQGEQAENIEQAITAFQNALKVRTYEAFPEDWAATQNNLANAYRDRIRGTQAENIEQAIAAYKNALQVYTYQAFPHHCRGIARDLGNFYFEQQKWASAAETYVTAIQAAELLYQRANLLDSKAAELSATADLPRCAAYAFARIDQLEQAVLTLEQGRARGLSETLDRDRANLSQLQQNHPELFEQYQNIAQQLRNLEAQQRERMTSEERHSVTPEFLRTEAQRLRQMLTATIEQIRQVEDYADFLAQPDLDDIQKAVHSEVPLVYLVPTPAGNLALIVAQDGITDLWLDDITDNKLIDLLNNTWFNTYRQQLSALQNYQTDKSAENLQAYEQVTQAWYDTIEQVTRQLWEPLMSPVINHLKQHQFQQATLIPTGPLNFLPLHAAWTEDPAMPTGKRCALDEILFTYAPNARSINAAREIAQQAGTDAILAIDNPLQDLPNSSREVTAAVASFSQPQILKHKDATHESVLAALPNCNVLHLSCHGTANLREPLNSGLAMSDKLLTLRDLLNLRLSEQGGIRLAVLSACETGLAGTELADEAVSLPTGLLQAGVAGVVASLWSVSELSTMMLLVRFYDYWRNENLEPAAALRQAQFWIRDSSEGELADYFGLLPKAPKARTYAHPFHWAAFSYTGV